MSKKRIVRGTWGVVLLVMMMTSGCGLIVSEQAYAHQRLHKAFWQDTNSSQSPADRMHTQRQVANQDARAIVDDLDFILMRERPSRLSRWHNR